MTEQKTYTPILRVRSKKSGFYDVPCVRGDYGIGLFPGVTETTGGVTTLTAYPHVGEAVARYIDYIVDQDGNLWKFKDYPNKILEPLELSLRGPQGLKGETGDPFRLSKIYETKKALDDAAAEDEVLDGGFAIVWSFTDPTQEEQGQIYVKQNGRYEYLQTFENIVGPRGRTFFIGAVKIDGVDSSEIEDITESTRGLISSADVPLWNEIRPHDLIITKEGRLWDVAAEEFGDKEKIVEYTGVQLSGKQGTQGKQGKVYLPTVSDEGILSWKLTEEEPGEPLTPQNIKGEMGTKLTFGAVIKEVDGQNILDEPKDLTTFRNKDLFVDGNGTVWSLEDKENHLVEQVGKDNALIGPTGNGIEKITRTSDAENYQDIYTIEYTNGNKFDCVVDWPRSIIKIDGPVSVDGEPLQDKYTICFSDNTTTPYIITNGRGIDNVREYKEGEEKVEVFSEEPLARNYVFEMNDDTKEGFYVFDGRGIRNVREYKEEDGEVEVHSNENLARNYVFEMDDDTLEGFYVLDGNGIKEISLTTTTDELTNTYTITFTDDKKEPFQFSINDGATFTPSVSEDGLLSWTNDGEKDNPSPVDIKGWCIYPGVINISEEGNTTYVLPENITERVNDLIIDTSGWLWRITDTTNKIAEKTEIWIGQSIEFIEENDEVKLQITTAQGTIESPSLVGPIGETGPSGVYVGDTEPTEPDISVWIDTKASGTYNTFDELVTAVAAALRDTEGGN